MFKLQFISSNRINQQDFNMVSSYLSTVQVLSSDTKKSIPVKNKELYVVITSVYYHAENTVLVLTENRDVCA